jgi:hypothetical protein
MKKEVNIKFFNKGVQSLYVDKGDGVFIYKNLNQLIYRELKVGDLYMVDSSFGLDTVVENFKKCKLTEIIKDGSSYKFIFELIEYDKDLTKIEWEVSYLGDKSIAYNYKFANGKISVLDEIEISTLSEKTDKKLDNLFNLTIDSNGKIDSFKKIFK